MSTMRDTSHATDDHAHQVLLDSLHEELTGFAKTADVLRQARRAFVPPQRLEEK